MPNKQAIADHSLTTDLCAVAMTPIQTGSLDAPEKTAEQIARGLTEAQRAAVLALPANGSCADEYSTPPWPNLWMRVELGDLGEMRPGAVFNHGFRLTPLGQAVRAILTGAQ